MSETARILDLPGLCLQCCCEELRGPQGGCQQLTRRVYACSAVVKSYEEPKVDASKAAFTFGRPDLDLLRRFCADRFGWDQDKVDQLIQPVLAVSGAKLHSKNSQHRSSQLWAALGTGSRVPCQAHFSRWWQRVSPRGMDFSGLWGFLSVQPWSCSWLPLAQGSLVETSKRQRPSPSRG